MYAFAVVTFYGFMILCQITSMHSDKESMSTVQEKWHTNTQIKSTQIHRWKVHKYTGKKYTNTQVKSTQIRR